MFFGSIIKTRWLPLPLIGWDIFDFSETAERNLTKLDRKQDLIALFQVCVFQVDRKNKMAAPAYDLMRHFQLVLWNRWIEFNKTWQEARSQHPLPGLRFSGWSEKQDSRLVLWLAETFSTFPMKPLNGIQRNLTKQVLNVLYQVCVFRADPKKQYGRPSLWLAETYFDFSSETAERNSGKLDRKQDLNVLYQVWKYSNDLEACWMKCCYFFLVPFQIFSHVLCTQVSDSGPLGLLFLDKCQAAKNLKEDFLYRQIIFKGNCFQYSM